MLVPRVTITADTDDATVAAAMAEWDLIAERTLAVAGSDLTTTDPIEAATLYDLGVETFSRAILTSPVTVQQHTCPHVAGFEESTYGPCTDAAYNPTSTVVS